MLITFACSLTGVSHVKREAPGQDYSLSRRVHRGNIEYAICAVADGVGSCAYSQYGSEAAVTTAVNFLSEKLTGDVDTSELPAMEQLIQDAFYEAKDASTIDLMEKMKKPMTSFSTTLTLAVYSNGTLWYGHCGDGGIIVLYTDGNFEMITTRHKGDEISSVYPLSEVAEWEFGVAQKEVASLVMMTDGILDHYVPMFSVSQRLYYPALGPVLQPRFSDVEEIPENEQMQYAEGRSGAMHAYILEKLLPALQEEGVTDDLSYAAIIDYERANNVPDVEFDRELWINEVNAHYERQRELLRQPFPASTKPDEEKGVVPESTEAVIERAPTEGGISVESSAEVENAEDTPVEDDPIEEVLTEEAPSEGAHTSMNVPVRQKPVEAPSGKMPSEKASPRKAPSGKAPSGRVPSERGEPAKRKGKGQAKDDAIHKIAVGARNKIVAGARDLLGGMADALDDYLSKQIDDKGQ